jgi:hypothetical protein
MIFADASALIAITPEADSLADLTGSRAVAALFRAFGLVDDRRPLPQL